MLCCIRTQITTVLLVLLSSLIPPSVLSFTSSSNHRQQQTKLKMSTTEIAAPQKIDGISSPLLLDNYDTFLLDMWGGKLQFYCIVSFLLLDIHMLRYYKHYIIHNKQNSNAQWQ